MNWEKIETFKHRLREERRIKFSCDYGLTFKYNELRIMCPVVYKEHIAEVAEELGIIIKEYFTY